MSSKSSLELAAMKQVAQITPFPVQRMFYSPHAPNPLPSANYRGCCCCLSSDYRVLWGEITRIKRLASVSKAFKIHVFSIECDPIEVYYNL